MDSKLFLNLTEPKILIIGDIFLDHYWYGSSERISPEAPVPVVNFLNEKIALGGAGNVAMNLRGLDCNVSLIGNIGDDSDGSLIIELLEKNKIDLICHSNKTMKSIRKLRINSNNHHLLRVDFESNSYEPLELKVLIDSLNIEDFDLIILSDYNKGTLKDISEIIHDLSKLNIPIIVDPKGRDFTKYRHSSVLTPNLLEFESIVGSSNSEDEILQKAQDLIHSLNIDAILLTKADKGMSLYEDGQSTFHIPSVAKEIYDVTGAGDTVIAVFSACLASGQTIKDSAIISNIAAGIVVGLKGTASVNLDDLRNNIINYNAFN